MTISKGDHVRIRGYTKIYQVDQVDTKEKTFYAVSTDGCSGHWFDLDEVFGVLREHNHR